MMFSRVMKELQFLLSRMNVSIRNRGRVPYDLTRSQIAHADRYMTSSHRAKY